MKQVLFIGMIVTMMLSFMGIAKSSISNNTEAVKVICGDICKNQFALNDSLHYNESYEKAKTYNIYATNACNN